MNRILVDHGDLLLDCSSDLPMLPLPLLPLLTSSVLPPEPVMAPSAAVSRVRVPQCRGLVLDNLPGCQYRMTDVDPAFGLQSPAFPGIRWGSQIGVSPELPSGALAAPYGPGGGCVDCPTAAA